MTAFDAHPLLVLALGLLALPLLLDAGHRKDAATVLERGREPLGLLLAGLLMLAPALVVGRWLGTAVPEGAAALPWLLAWLAAGGLLTALAEPLLARLAGSGAARLWPALAFWPLLEAWPGAGGHAAWRTVVAGLAGAVLLLLLRGVLERFRQNRPPRGLDGLPVRLLALGALLWLVAAGQSWLAGSLP